MDYTNLGIVLRMGAIVFSVFGGVGLVAALIYNFLSLAFETNMEDNLAVSVIFLCFSIGVALFFVSLFFC